MSNIEKTDDMHSEPQVHGLAAAELQVHGLAAAELGEIREHTSDMQRTPADTTEIKPLAQDLIATAPTAHIIPTAEVVKGDLQKFKNLYFAINERKTPYLVFNQLEISEVNKINEFFKHNIVSIEITLGAKISLRIENDNNIYLSLLSKYNNTRRTINVRFESQSYVKKIIYVAQAMYIAGKCLGIEIINDEYTPFRDIRPLYETVMLSTDNYPTLDSVHASTSTHEKYRETNKRQRQELKLASQFISQQLDEYRSVRRRQEEQKPQLQPQVESPRKINIMYLESFEKNAYVNNSTVSFKVNRADLIIESNDNVIKAIWESFPIKIDTVSNRMVIIENFAVKVDIQKNKMVFEIESDRNIDLTKKMSAILSIVNPTLTN